MEKFHKLYPNIVITINTDSSKELIKQLKNAMIDIIICKKPTTEDLELDYTKVDETKYIFVANENYKELLNKRVNINELINYPILLQKYPSNSRISADRYFKKNNVKVELKLNIGSSNLIIDFACIGYGVGYVTKLYAQEELKEKKIYEINVEPKPENIEYGIIRLKNNILPLYCNILIDYLLKNKI